MVEKSQKLVTKCSKRVGRGSVEAETAGMPSKPGKDLFESFIRQRRSLGSESSFLVAVG